MGREIFEDSGEDRIHKFLLRGSTVKFIVRMRDGQFDGSWDKMIEWFQQKGSLEQKKDLSIMKALKEYEKKHEINLAEVSGFNEEKSEIEIEKNLLCEIRLSTGYEATIYIESAKEDIRHLVRAIMGEILFPVLKSGAGAQKAMGLVQSELVYFIEKLDDRAMPGLLHILLLEAFFDEYQFIEKKANEESTSDED